MYHIPKVIMLKPVHQLRDLGFLISSYLSWSPHIKSMAKAESTSGTQFASYTRQRWATFRNLRVYRTLHTNNCWHEACILLGPYHSSLFDGNASSRALHLPLEKINFSWKNSNDLNILFVSRPSLENLVVIPSESRFISAANQIPFKPVICRARPYIFECNAAGMLFIPYIPSSRGYIPPYKNSLLVWKDKRGGTSSLWGGQKIRRPRQVLTELDNVPAHQADLGLHPIPMHHTPMHPLHMHLMSSWHSLVKIKQPFKDQIKRFVSPRSFLITTRWGGGNSSVEVAGRANQDRVTVMWCQADHFAFQSIDWRSDHISQQQRQHRIRCYKRARWWVLIYDSL